MAVVYCVCNIVAADTQVAGRQQQADSLEM